MTTSIVIVMRTKNERTFSFLTQFHSNTNFTFALRSFEKEKIQIFKTKSIVRVSGCRLSATLHHIEELTKVRRNLNNPHQPARSVQQEPITSIQFITQKHSSLQYAGNCTSASRPVRKPDRIQGKFYFSLNYYNGCVNLSKKRPVSG